MNYLYTTAKFNRKGRGVLELSEDGFIGAGLHRHVYIHPENPAYCIKIVFNGDNSESKREQLYYRHLQRRNIDWQMLPQFFGNETTNLGSGAVFELIRDSNGEIAKTLEYYLESPELTAQNAEGLLLALPALKHYLLDNRVITMTMKPKNIMYQRDNNAAGKLIIIDNIGNSDLLPLANYCSRVASMKINRKWLRFIESMRKDYANSSPLQKCLDQIS